MSLIYVNRRANSARSVWNSANGRLLLAVQSPARQRIIASGGGA
jgi:DNA-binding IclR family transcriptional regulator